MQGCIWSLAGSSETSGDEVLVLNECTPVSTKNNAFRSGLAPHLSLMLRALYCIDRNGELGRGVV